MPTQKDKITVTKEIEKTLKKGNLFEAHRSNIQKKFDYG